MGYNRQCTVGEVIENYSEYVPDIDCAKAFMAMREVGFEGTFFEQMYFIRELLNSVGYQIPFRVGGYRRNKR